MSTKRRPRRAGIPWRLLVHEVKGRGYSNSHTIEPRPDPRPHDTQYRVYHELPETTEFDELVVGRWCHIEQMDTGTWWMNIGGVTLWVWADSDGKPKSVTVYGPGAYAEAEPGVRYEFTGCDRDYSVAVAP